MLKGTLLAESLRIGAELRVSGVRMTRVSRRDVSASVSADQPPVWTFLDFEAADDAADALAQSLARCLLAEGGWYANFMVGDDHVIVFANRIFRYRCGDLARRAEVVEYGRRVGVPEHQLDWTD
jgi:hypothetical protein